MEPKVVLCADSESVRDPRFVGLEGESLEAQDWLRVFCSAAQARKYLKDSAAQEVWVASSDDVDPINLAAALKRDSKTKEVYLLAFQGTGSLKSRASAAGIDGTLSQQLFVSKYAAFKKEARTREVHAGFSSGIDVEALSFDDPSKALRSKTQDDQLRCESAVFSESVYVKEREPKEKSDTAVNVFFGGSDNASAATSISLAEKKAHILSIVSASGGSGKSTLAALSAIFSQALGYRTLLFDADFQFGDMHYLLGVKETLSISDIVRDKTLISRLRPEGMLPALLAAPAQLEQYETILESFPQVIEDLRSHFDVVVVNTGAFWTDQHAMLLERTQTALFVVDQRPSAVRECRHALELCSRCGIAAHPFVFVVNQCVRNAPLSSVDVSCALQGAQTIELPDGGREVSEYLALGLPFELIESRNSLCLGIEQMLIELLPEKEQSQKEIIMPKKQKGLFRLGKRRRRVACL